jgi:hypothetical protein
MSEGVAAAIAFTVALLGIVEVVLFRLGHLSKWPRRYFEAGATPSSVRNGIFGVLPWSLAILCFFLMVAAAQLPWAAGYVVLLLLVFALALFVLGFRWMSHPPEFLKPEWMRAEEAAIRSGARAAPATDLQVEVSPRYYAMSWVGLALCGVVGAILLGPGPVLIGIGVGVPYLIAMRPRRRDKKISSR